jgi:hypothetical protein
MRRNGMIHLNKLALTTITLLSLAVALCDISIVKRPRNAAGEFSL